MGILDEILAHKRAEVAALGPAPSPETVARDPYDALVRRPGAPLALITEIKRRSPSAGPLSTVLSPAERAAAYARAGARAISVLTDARFFDGSFEHLGRARAACDAPILCKDFVVDERQLDWARASGADLVLLIVRVLDDTQLRRLGRAARLRGLTALFEAATPDEVERAVGAGARVIGVNARDLDTLVMDAERATAVLESIPRSIVSVHLSGLRTPDDVAKVAATHAHAALVGEALMRLDDPEPLLREMVAAAG